MMSLLQSVKNWLVCRWISNNLVIKKNIVITNENENTMWPAKDIFKIDTQNNCKFMWTYGMRESELIAIVAALTYTYCAVPSEICGLIYNYICVTILCHPDTDNYYIEDGSFVSVTHGRYPGYFSQIKNTIQLSLYMKRTYLKIEIDIMTKWEGYWIPHQAVLKVYINNIVTYYHLTGAYHDLVIGCIDQDCLDSNNIPSIGSTPYIKIQLMELKYSKSIENYQSRRNCYYYHCNDYCVPHHPLYYWIPRTIALD